MSASEAFLPLADKILVLPDVYREDVTDVGLIVKTKDTLNAASATHLGRSGVVVAVGPGKADKKGRVVPMDVKVGDKVFFGEFQYRTHYLNDVKHLILQEADICWIEES
jgi:chaperonin GroES